jgi:2',3'-cyclic-nucleotide 2'-phosphodiesterase (5'-nucleotidase family)
MRETVGAELGLMNSGGIRANRVYPPGAEITRKDILAELPFGNRVVKLEIRGDVLLAALENGFSQVEDGAGRFPQVSGMTVEADLSAPAGSRVKSVKVNGAPLDPSQTYTLAAVDFISAGGDGYHMLVDVPRILSERDGPLLASAVMAHLRKRGEVRPGVEGRITVER